MIATDASQEYLDTLLRYYEEEIEGEAYFSALAERLDAPQHKQAMMLMAEAETYAAAAVRPLIEKYHLRPRSRKELHASGRAQADGKIVNWDQFIAGMKEPFLAFIDDFKRLELMAPDTDLPALRILTAHEVAAVKFLDLEMAENPASTTPLEKYLETGTA